MVRFLLEKYGWPTMRAVLNEFRKGETRFDPIVRKIMHIDFRTLTAKYNSYAITHFFFHSTGEADPVIPGFEVKRGG